MDLSTYDKPAPIVEACFMLNSEIHEIIARFPKTNKYLLGDQLGKDCLQLLTATAKTNFTRDMATRHHEIIQLQANLFAIRVLCCLGHKLKCIPHGQFAALNLKIENLAKQYHGWAKWAASATKTSASSPTPSSS
jgi:hypothetical protein